MTNHFRQKLKGMSLKGKIFLGSLPFTPTRKKCIEYLQCLYMYSTVLYKKLTYAPIKASLSYLVSLRALLPGEKEFPFFHLTFAVLYFQSCLICELSEKQTYLEYLRWISYVVPYTTPYTTVYPAECTFQQFYPIFRRRRYGHCYWMPQVNRWRSFLSRANDIFQTISRNRTGRDAICMTSAIFGLPILCTLDVISRRPLAFFLDSSKTLIGFLSLSQQHLTHATSLAM